MVGAFDQGKALVGAIYVITNLQMDLLQALRLASTGAGGLCLCPCLGEQLPLEAPDPVPRRLGGGRQLSHRGCGACGVLKSGLQIRRYEYRVFI